MGGSHVAMAGEFSVLLSNPAGLASSKRQLFVAQIGLHGTGPLFDMANAFSSGDDAITAFSSILASNGNKLYTGADIPGPISFGYAGGGLGFGLFNNTRLVLNAASASSIGARAMEELLLMGGYAVRIPLGGGHSLDAGLAAKGFVRGEVARILGILDLGSLLADPVAFLDRSFAMTTGVGLDAGLRYSWREVLAVGLACRDAYSPALVTTYDSFSAFVEDPATAHPSSESGTIAPELNFGFAWSPSLAILGGLVDSFVLAIDYSDILDLLSTLPRNAILNLGVGLELRFLEILSVRAGIRQTLLSAGFGLDLGVFKLNLSAFGEEMGREPGDRSVYNLLLSLEFVY